MAMMDLRGIFRHRDWEKEIVPELHGSNGRLEVVIFNLPCLRDRTDGTRKFLFHHFGAELLDQLCADHLSDIEHVRRLLSADAKVVRVCLRNLPAVTVHLRGQVALDRERFFADLADCLVCAFRTERILH
jgi:hypothetical protein